MAIQHSHASCLCSGDRDRGVFVLTPEAATKLKIVAAVDRPIDKITVRQICEGCGIARSTFYSHFESKYDMFPWLVTTLMEQSVDRIGRGCTWTQGLADYLGLLRSSAGFLRYALAGWDNPAPLADHRRAAITQTLERCCGVHPTKEQRLLIGLYVDAEIHFCRQWCAGSLPLGGEALVALGESLVPAWLHDALASPGGILPQGGGFGAAGQNDPMRLLGVA